MRLQQHSHKPEPRFFGKDDYHLGVELEIEAPDYDKKMKGLDLSAQPRFCYAKSDGSLAESGWELVTHPIARNYWLAQNDKKNCVKSFFELVNGLRELGYTSHTGSRCGLHVHVSYSAFKGVARHRAYRPALCIGAREVRSALVPPPTKGFTAATHRFDRARPHVYWFLRLVNCDLFRKLSQRDTNSLNQWAAQRTIKLVRNNPGGFLRQSGRYLATNVNDHTIEVRLFRGNMREDRIRKSIEAVIAGVEFTRNLTSKMFMELKADGKALTKAFLTWTKANSATYPHLHNYLVEIGTIPAPTTTTPEAIVCA